MCSSKARAGVGLWGRSWVAVTTTMCGSLSGRAERKPRKTCLQRTTTSDGGGCGESTWTVAAAEVEAEMAEMAEMTTTTRRRTEAREETPSMSVQAGRGAVRRRHGRRPQSPPPSLFLSSPAMSLVTSSWLLLTTPFPVLLSPRTRCRPACLRGGTSSRLTRRRQKRECGGVAGTWAARGLLVVGRWLGR